MTVLIGKNNEGKSNLIRALDIAMNILRDAFIVSRRRSVPRSYYQWKEDFPLSLQNSRKLKKKYTEFRLDFELTEEETNTLYQKIGSFINKDLSVFIQIRDNDAVSITIPKRGKNAKALSAKIVGISEFICSKIDIQYIPAIRSESNAYDVISDIIEAEFINNDENEEYKKAIEYIQKYQNDILKELSNRIKTPLYRFMPNIKGVSLSIDDKPYKRRYMSGKMLNIEINDGVSTSLTNKGDGVKSLTTIAILSQVKTSKNRIIMVDEPENHLHPEAIHYIKKVLFELSQDNQIIVSTHNPIFTNRLTLSSNIIVFNGKAEPAKRIDDIRKNLGVMVADNLMYSDYVIVVEGPSDKEVFTNLLQSDDYLREFLETGFISIRSIGGTQNLQSELYNLERYLCKYIVVLDSDKPGKDTVKEIQQKFSIGSSSFRFFKLEGYSEVELEDLYDVDLYKELFLSKYQLDVTKGQFKNKSKKWTSRIKDIAALTGQELNDDDINGLKKTLSELADVKKEKNIKTEAGALLRGIIEKIKSDVEELTAHKNG